MARRYIVVAVEECWRPELLEDIRRSAVNEGFRAVTSVEVEPSLLEAGLDPGDIERLHTETRRMKKGPVGVLGSYEALDAEADG